MTPLRRDARLYRPGSRSPILAGMPDPAEPIPAITHYANGKVKFRGAHLDGEMHGPWEWYRTDGSLMRTGAFQRGTQVGVWRTHDRTGRVVKETTYDEPK